VAKMEQRLNPGFLHHISDKVYDHGKRLLYGSNIAMEAGCNFVMPVDADDFVSNKIAGWVEKYSDEKYGWYVNKGYILNGQSKILIKVACNMYQVNGSTHIIHTSLLPKENLSEAAPSAVCFFSSHGYLRERIRQQSGAILTPIPFYSVIYYAHSVNWSAIGKTLQSDWIRTIGKYLLRGVWFSKKLKSEFGLNG